MDFKFAVGDRVRIIDPDNMREWSYNELFTTESCGTILRCRDDGDDDRYYPVQWDDVDLGEWCVAESEITLESPALTTGYDADALAAAIRDCLCGAVTIRVDSRDEKAFLVDFASSMGLMEENCSADSWTDYRFTTESSSRKLTFSLSQGKGSVVPLSSFETSLIDFDALL